MEAREGYGLQFWIRVLVEGGGLVAAPECRKFVVGRVVGANSTERECE
jgi:hypothetical protein